MNSSAEFIDARLAPCPLIRHLRRQGGQCGTLEILNMMPGHAVRRVIIREWMSLPKDKRQREEQAAQFATSVAARLTSVSNPHQTIMRWLMPRIAKS